MPPALLRPAYLLCLLLWLAAISGCQTPGRTFPPGSAIPFELENGFIRVEVDAGHRVLDFMVDTGAGSTVLNFATAQRLRLKHGEAVPVYGVRALGTAYRVSGFKGHLAGHPLKSDLYALPLRRLGSHDGRPLDGLIGQDFFAGRIVEIDFATRRIHVRASPPPLRPGMVVLPMRRMHDTLCVPVSVNGQPPQWTRLDTGCGTPLEWAGPWGQARPTVRREVVGTVRLGEATHEGVLIGLHPRPIFHDEAGLLGNRLLSRYRVTIDSRAMKLYLEPLSR